MDFEQIEELRKNVRNIKIIGGIMTLVITTVFYLITHHIPLSIFIFCFVAIIILLISQKPSRKYLIALKENVELKVLKRIFTDLKYEADKGIDKNVTAKTKIIYFNPDSSCDYKSKDYIEGRYNDINVVQANVEISTLEMWPDGEGTYSETLFEGKWLIFDLKKQFKVNTIVCSKKFNKRYVNYGGDNFEYKKIKINDKRFKKMFRVRCQDDQEVFNILTPELMRKINHFRVDINGLFFLGFINDKLHVGIQNKNPLKKINAEFINVFKKTNIEKISNDLYNETKVITNFVDDLNKEQGLFKDIN